jgi:hypothetical protein
MKGLKTKNKIAVKRIRTKIKIKNKLEWNSNSLIEGLNWKQKKIRIEQKNQKNKDQIRKKYNIINLNWKIKWEDKIENH